MSGLKVLYFDIETSPIQGAVWQLYDANVFHVFRESHITMIGWKWGHQKKTNCFALPDYKNFKKDETDDSALIEHFFEVVEEADVTVAHNSPFDWKTLIAQATIHDIQVPPIQKLCTLQMARKGKYTSKKLDYLAKRFGLAGKIKTDKDLWIGVFDNDPKAWADMIKYCKQDVKVLQGVHERLAKNADITAYYDEGCPTCGSKLGFKKDGVHRTKQGSRYQRYRCKFKSCDKVMLGRKMLGKTEYKVTV